MQKEKLWGFITRKNPAFTQGNVTLTPRGLRKLFETAYDEGHKQGFESGKAMGAETIDRTLARMMGMNP